MKTKTSSGACCKLVKINYFSKETLFVSSSETIYYNEAAFAKLFVKYSLDKDEQTGKYIRIKTGKISNSRCEISDDEIFFFSFEMQLILLTDINIHLCETLRFFWLKNQQIRK